MIPGRRDGPWSYGRTLAFWWVLLILVQQAERVFLIVTTLRREPTTFSVLGKALLAGLRADLIAATVAILLAMALGLVVAPGLALVRRWRGATAGARSPWVGGLRAGAWVVGIVVLAVMTADMGYYHYSQQRLDLVFFEYVTDVFAQAREAEITGSQVGSQTAAELRQGGKWAGQVSGYVVVMAVTLAAWWLVFSRALGPWLARCESRAPYATGGAIFLVVLVGLTGYQLDRQLFEGRLKVHRIGISNATYYTIAQNPFWYAYASLRRVVAARLTNAEGELLRTMPEDAAVRVTRQVVGPGAEFPFARYPLVRRTNGAGGVRLEGRPNFLVVFVEGLDRRFLGQTRRGIRVTPFLDRLRGESVYFEQFYSNGAQTFHGLFASFCGQLPRSGLAAIRTHYANDFLCLPAALRRGGYRTEMVIGQSRDRASSHVAVFMARNGLDAMLDEHDFAPDAPRRRLGVVDGALFDLLTTRIAALQTAGHPFLLTTLTTGTHHPFEVPYDHPEVKALAAEPDRYVAPLRYVDVELERVFSRWKRDGLLKNTVVLVLGDHGRHEKIGQTDLERQVGHFMAPLYVWLDPSLRRPDTFRPRTVPAIVSQVDLLPTILALTGLTPPATPFFGRDASCLLVRECLEDNVAYLSSSYDDSVALVERDGVLLYSLRTRKLESGEIALDGPVRPREVTGPDMAGKRERLMALYVTGNLLLDRNRLWSAKELGGGR